MRLYRDSTPGQSTIWISRLFLCSLGHLVLYESCRISTYLSCEESADATEARVDSAGRGCEEYGGRLEGVERWDGSRSTDARGDGPRTSAEGTVLGDGDLDKLCLCARGLLSDLGSKCDALTRGSETEAVFGEATSSPMVFWERGVGVA